MARFTQTVMNPLISTGAYTQVSSTWTGGSVPCRFYVLAQCNHVIGDYATAADALAASNAGKYGVMAANVTIDFGPVDPSKMWVRSGSAQTTLTWETVC